MYHFIDSANQESNSCGLILPKPSILCRLRARFLHVPGDMTGQAAPPPSLSSIARDRLRPILAPPVRWLRRRAAAALHPWRRKSALAGLERLRPIRSVLVMCYGNICRSPYAASILQRQVTRDRLAITVTQGGFFGPNRPANDRGRTVAADRGVDLSTHCSRLVTREDATTTHLIIVMEQWQADKLIREFGAPPERLLVLGDIDPASIDSRTIADPYGLDVPFFQRTYDRLDRCIANLVRVIR